MNVVFQLVGGPWDGQSISTASPDEAAACFAKALLAMTGGGRVGACIPMISPAGQQEIDAGMSAAERQVIRPHEYAIVKSRRRQDQTVVVAEHVGRRR